jgi:hypothetical protein
VAVYYFHCTDGQSLILDHAGRRTRSDRDVEPLAVQVATEIMGSVAAPIDWSDWLVSVQDHTGSMMIVVPFPAERLPPEIHCQA